MPKSIKRTYSHYTQDACSLLGVLIRSKRIERKQTAQDLAERAGISRSLLQRIEEGNPKCEIGVVFELARMVGISLFDLDERNLELHLEVHKEKLTLLPKSVHRKKRSVRGGF